MAPASGEGLGAGSPVEEDGRQERVTVRGQREDRPAFIANVFP